MTPDSESHSVTLTIPPRADYVALARLAVSALGRVTPLDAEEIADLKLAITEAATPFVAGAQGTDPLTFTFELSTDSLVLSLRGVETGGADGEEADLRRAILEATVDDCSSEPGAITLVKRLRPREPGGTPA